MGMHAGLALSSLLCSLRCDLRELCVKTEGGPPALEDIHWGGKCTYLAPLGRAEYEAMVEADSLFVLSPGAWHKVCQFGAKVQEVVRQQLRHAEVQQVGWHPAWHCTLWTRAALQAAHVVEVSTAAAVCVMCTNGKGYNLKHVFLPHAVLPEVHASHLGRCMQALGNSRFGGAGQSVVQGESVINQRGTKSFSGSLRMYGTRSLNGSSVERYGPRAPFDATCSSLYDEHANAIARLERETTPEVAEARRLAAVDIPTHMRADRGGQCSAASVALSRGYVIGPHGDEAAVNETVVFTPMQNLPEDMEWCFAAAGLLHPLPRVKGEVCYITMLGKGVWHGTLPSSSREEHDETHYGLGSALCSQARILRHWRSVNPWVDTNKGHK